MRKILLSVVLATTLALTSCQFDDSALWSKLDEYGQSIKDHEQRISALEELCKQMNTNIEALQTLVDALEKRDYVTNVSEVRSNGEVIGYTISFANSDTVTIYHGQDGADGKNGQDGSNGKDGYTPQIGVMKDTDGIYYWTLDGEWLLDGKGNKIQANGVNGTDGTNGSNGTNGATPQLKIENDYWYVSYDNGATWVQLGKATGEDGKDGQDGNDGADGSDGADGEDGKDGDSIFKSVTQDDEYVYFNLADGTMITLPKHDKENIQFEDLQVKAICCKNWDTNNDGELSYAEAAAVTDIGDVFRGNTNIIAFTELKYFTGITKLSAKAFSECTNLWKIEIPQNVISIESGDGSHTTSSGSSKAYGTFMNASLSSIKLPNSLSFVGDHAFNGCRSLVCVTIGNSVTSIGSYAFSGCKSLTSVTIPDSVTEIGDGAFRDCTSLTSITMSNSVTEIGDAAFDSCTSLTSISIPNSVTGIGYRAFYNCTSLNEIYCKPSTPPSGSSDMFKYYNAGYFVPICNIYVPTASVDAYKKASYWSNYTIVGYDFE